ncbi:DUF72 domain-containing protein [Sphingomonas nostoxanthinifaciens]|uniref:DUF72 domain-containing protein n=1 Tax=Sphingomonas nostoxanthinifaciens TaxID=2872652 RepID=UPI001CC1F092|nr:DUF72 domain-containing protein [Sphingomonas nostoxanthinifaciens]UAK25205.1 DUF72 domain-containing protein [Sphingomonas nostoxanthinifaciens]
MAGAIRVGIGGWTFEPWRETFYPKGHPKTRELEHASRHVTAIEINGTYYSTQKPATWADWAKRVPDDFVFAVKASRFCTNRKVLAEAGESIAKFVNQGLSELGPKLGPILWQFMGTKQFDPDDFGAFLDLLPKAVDGVPLTHAIEPRHESFRTPAFVAIARAAGVAIVVADAQDHPQFADLTGPFVYARLQDAHEEVPTGYDAAALDRWAEVAKGWAAGEAPDGLRYIEPPAPASGPRDVFVFMINGAKVRAPAAAMALLERV